MKRTKLLGKVIALGVCVSGLLACYVEASGPTIECRTVEVRRRSDVEVCFARCYEDGCREHCRVAEQWSRQHNCWIE